MKSGTVGEDAFSALIASEWEVPQLGSRTARVRGNPYS